ncbi:Holliday junction resolvase RecU [Planococcus lenghuensis]|uniref:Holliday junction resolvase RecU n=1 Tax=Planococcus lenghuensis TaxID=2213202 RepID=A0A1Q2L0L6_9BACL|nr:Holliday junction resolvase RecU [Planococcus lenghuensis]AQQ53597.1 Holliday junction resolvase RecU [Planococcus lenghuensis]
MAINYPNGKKFSPANSKPKKQVKKDFSFSNRGKTLEDELNESNAYYLERGFAVIHKKPIPLQIVKVDYPSRSSAVIREAYFRTPSTTDYNGVWNGIYIDFEAKETRNKTSFPLKNIHEHQVRHMAQVIRQQGKAFLIIRFSSLDRYFVVPFSLLEDSWNRMIGGGRKSIELAEIEQAGIEVIPGMYPRIDYLPAFEQLYRNEESEER